MADGRIDRIEQHFLVVVQQFLVLQCFVQVIIGRNLNVYLLCGRVSGDDDAWHQQLL